MIIASLRRGALRGLKGDLDECAVFYLMYLCIFTCSFLCGISVFSVHIVFLYCIFCLVFLNFPFCTSVFLQWFSVLF